MQCQNHACGATVDEDARVCPECGADLTPPILPGAGKVFTPVTKAMAQAARGGRGRMFANASLVSASVSCPLFLFFMLYVIRLMRQWGFPYGGWLFPHHAPSGLALVVPALCIALAAILCGHIALFECRGVPGLTWVRRRAWLGTLLGYLNLVVPIALITFAYFNKGRPNMDMAVCTNNLRQLGLVIWEYAEESKGSVFLPLSPQPGVLMFDAEAIAPDVPTGPLPFTCPTIRYAKQRIRVRETSDKPAPLHDDQSYFYLGYAVLDDDDVEAFAKAYREQIAEGGTFDEDLVVQDGEGTRILHRLSERVKEVWHATGDPNAVSPHEGREAHYQVPGVVTADVPVLIERDLGHVYTDWDGRPRGANVLFLYDGVQFVKSGTWPMTEKTQRILAELAELP